MEKNDLGDNEFDPNFEVENSIENNQSLSLSEVGQGSFASESFYEKIEIQPLRCGATIGSVNPLNETKGLNRAFFEDSPEDAEEEVGKLFIDTEDKTKVKELIYKENDAKESDLLVSESQTGGNIVKLEVKEKVTKVSSGKNCCKRYCEIF